MSPLVARQLANVAIAGVVIFAVSLVLLQYLSGQQQLIAVVDLERSPNGWLYRIAFGGLAVATAIAVGGLWRQLGRQLRDRVKLIPLGLLCGYCLLAAAGWIGQAPKPFLLAIPFVAPITILLCWSFIAGDGRFKVAFYGAITLSVTVVCAQLAEIFIFRTGLGHLPSRVQYFSSWPEWVYYALIAGWLLILAGRLHQIEHERKRKEYGDAGVGYTSRSRSLALLLVSHTLEFITDLTPYENWVYLVREWPRPKEGTREVRMTYASDTYVFVMLAALLAVWWLVDGPPLIYFAAAFAMWRLTDILATNFRILLVDADKPGWGVVSASRSVLLGLINVAR
jgi:hypothetical protein